MARVRAHRHEVMVTPAYAAAKGIPAEVGSATRCEQHTDGDAEQQPTRDFGPRVTDEFLQALLVERVRLAQLLDDGVQHPCLPPHVLAQTTRFADEVETEDQGKAEQIAVEPSPHADCGRQSTHDRGMGTRHAPGIEKPLPREARLAPARAGDFDELRQAPRDDRRPARLVDQGTPPETGAEDRTSVDSGPIQRRLAT